MPSKKKIENEAKLERAMTTLSSVADSNITPRNIRKTVKDSINMLQDSTLGISVKFSKGAESGI